MPTTFSNALERSVTRSVPTEDHHSEGIDGGGILVQARECIGDDVGDPWYVGDVANDSLFDIWLMHQGLEEGISEVEFGKYMTMGSMLKDVVNNRNQCVIFDHHTVEAPEITEESKFAIIFLDKECWGSLRRTGWTEMASGMVLFDLLMEGFMPG
ncbi:hypothetical protein AYX15_07002 [Cryptococcus neoformans]|nr:hypothetical protein AYX15_07002 [Cryptococcus neoformans var. grubii]